jgi:phospholipid/cholesterol/gamma-HCH transport system permease protein
MKVSEEFDALRALGFGPVQYLVLPRLLALLVAVPVLTIVGDVVGVVGGLVVAWSTLGITPLGYLHEVSLAVHPKDILTGLLKSGAFAWAIAVIACQQGFATSGGAEGVGKRTTATVVGCLFAIVLLDAIATVAWRGLGW